MLIETRVRAKELLVQTVQGDVIALSVDRDETLASFKKRLQNIGIWNLEKATLESLNGSLRIPLGEYSDREDTGKEFVSLSLSSVSCCPESLWRFWENQGERGNFADGINKFEDLTYEIRAEYTDDVFFF